MQLEAKKEQSQKSGSNAGSKDWKPVSENSSLVPTTREGYGTVIGDVKLSALVRVGDLAERAVTVYAALPDSPALSPGSIAMIAEDNPNECASRVIWQRKKKPLDVTMEEVCEQFGCEVRIVKEKR